jgi:hypothetical protein
VLAQIIREGMIVATLSVRCWRAAIQARRAASVEPVAALRSE